MAVRTAGRTRRLAGAGLALFLAAGAAVLTGLGRLPAIPGWVAAVVAAVAGLSGLLFLPLSERLKLRVATEHHRNAALENLYRTGAIVEFPLSDVDPGRLGVHPAWQLPGTSPVPPYVPRTADAELDRAVAAGGFVVIQGHSAAGKSRAAYEALRRNAERCGWRSVLVPRDGAALRSLADAAVELAGVVVWLDDLERYLTSDGLDDSLLAVLGPPGRSGVMLLATLRSSAREALGVDKDEAGPASIARKALARAVPIRLDRDFNPEELAAAELYRSDPRIATALDSRSGAGLAEHMAAGPAAAQRWQDGRDGANEVAAALISTAVDLRRAGYFEPVPLEWLFELHVIYLSPRMRHRLADSDRAKALAWAIEPVRGASSCLLPAGDDRYVAFDYLLDHVELRPGSPEVPDGVWQWLLDAASLGASSLTWIALAAQDRGRSDAAVQLWSRLAGDEKYQDYAMFHLGFAAQMRGDFAEAERCYRQAAKAGNTPAMSNLGGLAERRGDLAVAESWYRQAANAGHTMGMTNLGSLLLNTGRIEEARAAYRRAAAAGNPAGIHKEAILELLHGNPKRGIALLDKALRAGHPASARTFGLLLRTLPASAGVGADQIESVYQLAAAMGDVAAMCELARAHAGRGELDAAETWVRRALAMGSGVDQGEAELVMGQLMELRGRPKDEEAWYRRAAAKGVPGAMLNLGHVLMERGQYDEAEHWFHKALAAGVLEAEVNLGRLHRYRGRISQARHWYRRAARRGDPLAMRGLLEIGESGDE